MYTFRLSNSAVTNQAKIPEKATSLPGTYSDLADNPRARAKPTNIPAIGEYYVNSGNFCILFDIDEANQMIVVYGVVRKEYLHKILTGRLLIVDKN